MFNLFKLLIDISNGLNCVGIGIKGILGSQFSELALGNVFSYEKSVVAVGIAAD